MAIWVIAVVGVAPCHPRPGTFQAREDAPDSDFGISHLASLHQHDAIQMKRPQALSRKFGLQRREGELTGRVALQDKLNEAVTEMTHTVKQDHGPRGFPQIFLPPLMRHRPGRAIQGFARLSTAGATAHTSVAAMIAPISQACISSALLPLPKSCIMGVRRAISQIARA